MKRHRALLWIVLSALLLVAAGGLWVWHAKRQYVLNRQLIDSLTHGDANTALALVNSGADPNTRYAPPPMPSFKMLLDQVLHHAPPTDDSPTAFLLACGISWDATPDRLFPLVTCNENLLLLRSMLGHGANVNTMIWKSLTALHIAAFRERLHTVELLLQNGVDVNVANQYSDTPLMYATKNDTVNIARLLLSHGANPNMLDAKGSTALHWAVLVSPVAKDVLLELLAHGGDPNQCDKQGVSVLQYAQRAKRPDLVALLRRGGK